MTVFRALQILGCGRSIYFTNLKIDGRFDNERAMANPHSSSPVYYYDPLTSDDGRIFSDGIRYRSIVIFDEESGEIVAKEEFTPTPQEREECARYHACDFWNLEDNRKIPFVRRNKPRRLIAQVADKMDEYIVRNHLPLSNPEEEYGTCVSSFWLSEALADDPELAAKACRFRGKKLRELALLFQERTVYIDPEAEISYGEVFFIDFAFTRDDIQVRIWDGYPE